MKVITSLDNRVNIIVIGYNLPDLEKGCLESIIKETNFPYLLTFFDNYNSGYTLTEIWNKLIACSPCNYICLLNNDTKVRGAWLNRMMETLVKDKKIGFVGPSTNQCHSPQKKISSFEESQKHKNEIEIMKDPISGFCLLFRKCLWEKLRGFDEKYSLYGQESDLLDRAQKLGYDCVWRKDAFVFHYGEASIKKSGIDVKKERNKAKKMYWKDRGKKL